MIFITLTNTEGYKIAVNMRMVVEMAQNQNVAHQETFLCYNFVHDGDYAHIKVKESVAEILAKMEEATWI